VFSYAYFFSFNKESRLKITIGSTPSVSLSTVRLVVLHRLSKIGGMGCKIKVLPHKNSDIILLQRIELSLLLPKFIIIIKIYYYYQNLLLLLLKFIIILSLLPKFIIIIGSCSC
jgi:hypothetical protein